MSQPLIYIVDDEPAVAQVVSHWVTNRWGYTGKVFTTGKQALDEMGELPDLVLLDIMLPEIDGIEVLKQIKAQYPEMPVIMLSAQAQVDTAVETLRIGASDYFSKPIDFPKLGTSIKHALEMSELTREVKRLREVVESEVQFENILSNDGLMQEVFKLVNKVKDSDITVLIQGESGTGKELIARAVHFNSKRKAKPFVVLNCAAIPRELLESELFGHERGSFTGAVQRRIGKFEQADGGTLFLDEIGEMDPALQAKLLRVIQTGEFERVGGNESLRSNVRILAATNRDLKKAVQAKEFREDLYFRLSSFPIVLPPLRQRRSDVLLLAEHFLKRFAEKEAKGKMTFSRHALNRIYQYPWPGNVRELENAIERAVVVAEGKTVTENDLPIAVKAFSTPEPGDAASPSLAFDDTQPIMPFERLKEAAIRHALKLTEGNIVEAAKRLGIGRATLYRMMKRYRIEGA